MKNLQLLFLSIIIILFSCGKDEIKEITLPTNAKAGNIYNLETTTHEESGRTIVNGILVVKENHSKSDSRLIALPVKIYKTSNKEALEPVFYLTGGPGHSNLGYWPSDELLAERDIVLVGYRGVDGSSRIDCPEFMKGTEKHHLFSKESIKAMQNNVTSCLDKWENNGLDINCYTMTDVIDDMETARKTLNYTKVNLLSASYGTRLAQIFALRYPESIYRSIMVSVNPPGHFVWQPKTIDNQIEHYSKLWAKDSVYSKKTDDLAKMMKRVTHNMPKKWLFVDIDPDNVRFAAFMGLYHTNGAGSVFDAFIAADKGDPSGLALVSLMTDWQLKNMDVVWGDMLAKSFTDYNTSIDYYDKMKLNSNIIGSPGSQLFAVHEVWPVITKDTLFNQVQTSETETLLLSGNIDFSTPAEFARDELLPHLKNSKQYILSEYGHTGDIMYKNRKAFTTAITSYYSTGEADMSLYKEERVDFEPAMSFPKIAKLAIGAIVFLILLITGTILLIRRFIKRRKRKKLRI